MSLHKGVRERLNVPNLLSAYRLFAIPFILWAILESRRNAFFILVCVSLVTDILDGWIARRFHLETEFGARLDSLADIATSLTALLGFVILEQAFVSAHRVAFASLLVFNLTPQAVCLARFRRPTSLHLYSSKVMGYLQGFFILGYFMAGYRPWFFYLMITASLLAYTEALLILLIIPRLRSNVRGLYWVLSAARQGG
jgi:cardiolipin synthase